MKVISLFEEYSISRQSIEVLLNAYYLKKGLQLKGVSMLIAEIDKNMKERIRVSMEEYRGSRFIDLRVYWENDQGEWLPSKKGIALNKDCIERVINALQKASKELEA